MIISEISLAVIALAVIVAVGYLAKAVNQFVRTARAIEDLVTLSRQELAVTFEEVRQTSRKMNEITVEVHQKMQEIGPLIKTATGVAHSVKTTATLARDNLVSPLVEIAGLVSGVRKGLKLLKKKRRVIHE